MGRKLGLLSLVAVLIIMATVASAIAGVGLRAKVPFAFYAENQLLPAGDYRFEMGSVGSALASSVTIRAKDGKGIRLILARPEADRDAASHCLQFNQYGDTSFLTSVSISGHKANFKMVKLEKELKSQAQEAKSIAIIAQR